MTLEQLGFEVWYTDSTFSLKNTVYYRRASLFGSFYQLIKFNLKDREFELTNINSIDMLLLEAIYTKAKELFE